MSTNYALLTAPGTSAIAVLAVWGPVAWAFIKEYFQPAKKPLPEAPPGPRSWYGHFGAEVKDEVVLVLSHTQPLAVEIQCHGSPLILQHFYQLCENHGIHKAEPEAWLRDCGYTQTANAHQTQAWNLLPHALTNRTAKILLQQTRLPASLNFSPNVSHLGRHLTTPFQVAIAGEPNVGKSSLLNALAGFERSIVAPIPGTTRDTVSLTVAIQGWPIELTDTAGLRETQDEIEQQGMALAQAACESADLILHLVDSSNPNAALPAFLEGKAVLSVVNKIDLKPGKDYPDQIGISATTGEGLEKLMGRMVEALTGPLPHRMQAIALSY
jgi:tRNA modification GTPase